MQKKLLPEKISALLVLLFLAALPSCAWWQNSEALAKKKEMAEEKKAHFQALREGLAQGRLKKGAAPELIRERFGAPDDIFLSASSVSTFEKWTYENVVAGDTPQGGIPIQLYFNNNKLVSWSY